jgi:Flp pilus assembly pilin Flp
MFVVPLLRRWLRDGRGQDLVEYGLLAGFVSLAVYGGAASLGMSLNNWYGSFQGELATIAEESPSETNGLTEGLGSASGGTGHEGAVGEGDRGGRGGGKGNCSASGAENSDGQCQ